MSLLKWQSPLKHPQTHTVLSPHLCPVRPVSSTISQEKIEGHGLVSSQSFPEICAWLAGLLHFPAPSAVSPWSPVLNPNPCGTYSQPRSKSPFIPCFWGCLSCILLNCCKRAVHVCYILLSCFLSCEVKGAPNCLIPTYMAAASGFKSWCKSSSATPFPTPPTISYTCQHSCIFPAFLGGRS